MKPVASVLSVLAGALVSAISFSAQAVEYDICVNLNPNTTDSGLAANGVTEDRWTTANGGLSVPARGVYVTVSQGSWSATYIAHPDTGCFTVVRSGSGISNSGYTVRVHGQALVKGRIVRIHDGGIPTSSTSAVPGNTYSFASLNRTLSPTSTNTVNALSDPRWTAFAAGVEGVYRNPGTASATLSIGFRDDGDCDGSSSIIGNSELHIAASSAHLVTIGHCNGTAADSREKMIVTHELGHAMLRLAYDFDGDESPRDQTYEPPSSITSASPPMGSNCWNVSSYDMNSLEYTSQLFKEAYADFWSAAVWNNQGGNGTYVYRGVPYDLERWDNSGGLTTPGGFAGNFCGSNAPGVSTKGDWLRFLWDVYTVPSCTRPTFQDMVDLYVEVRENDRVGLFDLSNQNYDQAIMHEIVHGSIFNSCTRDAAEEYAVHNHITGTVTPIP